MKTLALVFSGQGSQAVGMGLSLYQHTQEAQFLFDKANAILSFDLKQACFEGPEETLTQTSYCQPALYVQGYSIYAYLKNRGLLEDLCLVFGLSLGELSALAAAGVYDFETGLRLVAKRGELMQKACLEHAGAMVSLLGGDRSLAQELCRACDVEMANLNCPGQIVLSGPKANIEKATEHAKTLNFKRVIPLNVAGAYHSRLMQSAATEFERFLKDFDFRAPQVPVLSNTHAKPLHDPQAIKEALVRQIVSPVLFEDCVSHAIQQGVDTFYECGPGAVLCGLIKRTSDKATSKSLGLYENLLDLSLASS